MERIKPILVHSQVIARNITLPADIQIGKHTSTCRLPLIIFTMIFVCKVDTSG